MSAARRIVAGWTVALSLVASGAGAATLRGETMGTTWQVNLPALGAVEAALMKPKIEDVLAAVNARMSTYRPDSELSRLNASESTAWQRVSLELMTVLRAARAVSEETNGAFDVTVGPLVNLWGFGAEARVDTPPPAAAVAAARGRVGYRLLELDVDAPRVRKRRPDLYVDLSAIAKGYAVDRVAALIEQAGQVNFLVDIGGELRVRGRNSEAQPWHIGIALPAAGRDDVARALVPGDAGIATSGDYRNFFDYAGHRYSHEIDPVSGAPIANGVASVTVVAPQCMLADAYATAFMVLGADHGLEVAKRLGLEAMFLLHAGTGYTTRASAGFPATPSPGE